MDNTILHMLHGHKTHPAFIFCSVGFNHGNDFADLHFPVGTFSWHILFVFRLTMCKLRQKYPCPQSEKSRPVRRQLVAARPEESL